MQFLLRWSQRILACSMADKAVFCRILIVETTKCARWQLDQAVLWTITFRWRYDSNWVGRFKILVFPPDLDNYWNNPNLRLNHRTCQEILCYHQNRMKVEINNSITESSSLYWFKDVASYGIENYLNLDLPSSIINVYAQTRLLNKFNEKIYANGMSYKFYNEQLCTICKYRKNDTLLHLLTECNITEPHRRHYMIHNKEELINLIKSNSPENVQKAVNFIKQSLRIRSFVLHE